MNRVSLYTRSYTGYESSDGQFEDLILEAVIHVTRRSLPGDGRFTRLPVGRLRESHFTAAFALDEPHLTDDHCWWAFERSVEALGHFGTPDVAPALERLRARPVAHARMTAKLEAVLAAPADWLTGPPRVFSE